ncbi:3-keto-5-aminohexanoate cleavage protein [Actinacidiphila yeochonensis]|uniref:3-keto-5-aminohexanoate cleavage protein n=1 Tax=Actinacidiphila yeochonensis TaxID=89050 RepID=UPI00056188D1|nr:3-keto-5-aminohexanoate cleavage protein [Actinacidiphila yeochonensis]
MLQVCLNGARTQHACPVLPVTPQQLGDAAAAAVAAGARSIHIHPKNADGADTLAAVHVDAAVAAVRASAPGVPIGVTTGAWTEADPERRAALVRSWSVLPDHASVNWHEEGAELVADALLEARIGVEAGLFSGTGAPERLRAWPRARRVLRVMAEVVAEDAEAAVAAAEDLLVRIEALDLRPAGRGPVLLHGQERGTWPVLALAADRGLDTRIGLEDTLLLPDGSPAPDNAALVEAARAVLTGASRR